MSTAKRPLIPLDKFPEQLRKFVGQDSPLAATKLVVQGLVPVSGPIKVCALYQASHLHEKLAPDAQKSLLQMQADELSTILKTLPPPIIDWVAEVTSQDPVRASAVFASPASAVSTLMRLLSSANEQVASQLADNQVKLMSNPIFLQSLCLNPALPQIIRERLIELAKFQKVDISWLAQSPFNTASAKTQPNIQSQSAESKATQQKVTTPKPTGPVATGASQSALKASSSASQVKSNSFALVGEEGRAPEVSRLNHHGLALENFPEQVQKFLVPDAPKQVVNLVLGGLFPMPVEVRVLALYHLAVTRAEVREKSIEAVRAIDTANLSVAIKSCGFAETLDWLADACLGADVSPKYPALDEHADLVSALTNNDQAQEVTIARLALYTSAQGCERIALNQQRLLNQASIIHALYYNPKFSTVQADRLLELAAREGVDLSWMPDAGDVLNEISGQELSPQSSDDHLLQKAIQVGQDEDPKDAAINAVLQEHAARRAAQQGQDDEQEAKPKKGYALIQSLNVAQKIRLALLGSQSDRAMLVKDANKVVSRAAIRSPAVSVSEALLYARNHSLNAGIIEYIARNRKWMQNYRLKVQIILNPKTPVNISLNALNSLRPAELRAVSQSHNVSGVVSQKAKDLIKKRQG